MCIRDRHEKSDRGSSIVVIPLGQCSVQGLESCHIFVLQFGPLNSQSLSFCDVYCIYRTYNKLHEKKSKLGAKYEILEEFIVQKNPNGIHLFLTKKNSNERSNIELKTYYFSHLLAKFIGPEL